jgi:penicillin-binding protein 2
MQLRPDKQRRWRPRYYQPRPAEVVERRFIILKIAVLVLFGGLLLQLARMQIVQHDEYAARAESNRLRTLPVLPARGLIYDRNGEVLVENEPIFSAGVVPADVPEEQLLAVVADLSQITGVPAQEIATDVSKAAKSKDPFTPVIVKDSLDEQTAFRLRERQPHLPGVQVLVESVRRYPLGSLVSHALGFVGRIDEEEYAQLRDDGYQLNDRLGKAGVEYTYESMLRGSPGYRQVEVDAAGQEIRTLNAVDPRPAGNLVLSIDLDLQRKVTEYLEKARVAGNSKNAVAIVMNVHSGELLSMVSLPAYDNNVFAATVDEAELQRLLDDPAKPMLNSAISEVYPPGSTFKQVTGSAALQEGVATPDTTIFSSGALYVPHEYGGGEDRFADWAAHGSMNFYRGLAMSSDVYFYYLSGGYHAHGISFDGLGATRLARYTREYGFGAPTGVDLPGEAAGNVPDPQWKEDTFGDPWYLGDTYHFGIGQGYLTVTPLQLLRVIAAIANGGDVLVPHVAKEIVDEQGNVLKTIEPEVQHRLSISDANLGTMREALRQAAEYGPARTGVSRYVTIAAKTGTAEFGQQLADGSYATSHAWYTAYAPYDNPEIAVVVFLEKGIGATHAGPVAKQIFDYYFQRKYLAEGGEQP